MSDSRPPLDLDEVKRRLPTLGARPSASADAAFAREVRETAAMSAEERIKLALRLSDLGRRLRDRA